MHQEQDRPSGGGQGGVSSSTAVLDQASYGFLWYHCVCTAIDPILAFRSASSFSE